MYTNRWEGGGSRAVGEDELGVLGVGYVRGIWDILLRVIFAVAAAVAVIHTDFPCGGCLERVMMPRVWA